MESLQVLLIGCEAVGKTLLSRRLKGEGAFVCSCAQDFDACSRSNGDGQADAKG
jgi:hypothetical protein